MSKLKIDFRRKYTKEETGNTVFVFAVKGPEAELDAYAEAQGDNIREDKITGEILYFTTRYYADTMPIVLTENGNYVVDTTQFDKLKSQVEQAGGDFGKVMENIAMKTLMGGIDIAVSDDAGGE